MKDRTRPQLGDVPRRIIAVPIVGALAGIFFTGGRMAITGNDQTSGRASDSVDPRRSPLRAPRSCASHRKFGIDVADGFDAYLQVNGVEIRSAEDGRSTGHGAHPLQPGPGRPVETLNTNQNCVIASIRSKAPRRPNPSAGASRRPSRAHHRTCSLTAVPAARGDGRRFVARVWAIRTACTRRRGRASSMNAVVATSAPNALERQAVDAPSGCAIRPRTSPRRRRRARRGDSNGRQNAANSAALLASSPVPMPRSRNDLQNSTIAAEGHQQRDGVQLREP